MAVVAASSTRPRSPSTGRVLLRELKRNRLAYLFLTPAMAVLVFVDFIPMVKGVWTSFHQYSLFRPLVRPFVGLDQYTELIHDPLFWRAMWQTAYYTVGAVAGQFVLGLFAAALLNQSARARGFFRGLVLIPWVVPGALAGMMFALLFTSTGLVNSFLRLIGLEGHGLIPESFAWLSNASTAMPVVMFTATWKGFPFFAVMLLAAMQAVPQDLYEAAKVDGASAWRSFRHVTLPGIRSTMLVSSLLGLIWTFNSIDLIYIMTFGGPYYSSTTLVMLAYQQAFTTGQVGYASAIAVVILALMAVLTTFYLILYRRVVDADR